MKNKIFFNIANFGAIIEAEDNLGVLEIYKKAPDLSHIPPIERRRLGKAARFCLSLLKDFPNLPVVFSSKYGEINRCFALQEALARAEPLSPASFCVSVHNAIAAQNAIFAKNNCEISAISANLSLENAVLEAIMKLEEYPQIAVLSYFEDINNNIFKKSNLIYALILVLENGKDFSLKFSPNLKTNAQKLANSTFLFLENMLNNKKSWTVIEENLIWEWKNETAI